MTGTQLMTREQASQAIDSIVEKCAPMALADMKTFSQTLALADGVKQIREIFLSHPAIRETIQSMQDTRLGFLTDRSPKAIADAKARNKQPPPAYTYEEVVECCIEAMFRGYRISGNEFNIIAGGMYAAKNGKYRRIIEHPDVTEFAYTITPPAYEGDQYAKVKCFATWLQKGKRMSLGISDPGKGIEDTCVFRIKVNAYMGEDGVAGKAKSKLFTRVLERIEGRVLPESTDVEPGDHLEQLPETTGGVRTLAPMNGEASATAEIVFPPPKGKEEAPGPEADLKAAGHGEAFKAEDPSSSSTSFRDRMKFFAESFHKKAQFVRVLMVAGFKSVEDVPESKHAEVIAAMNAELDKQNEGKK